MITLVVKGKHWGETFLSQSSCAMTNTVLEKKIEVARKIMKIQSRPNFKSSSILMSL